ncbi:cytochrome b [Dyella monticola]|uniref:Cytochrome b n=1 Tax=Dyella monticola TaxID=1927958 RepID=A0A370X1J7_9GAMM|nr:cytochrome b/b6 domain-containing protein [Dyella monticola]RDS82268.1 cytochrome b [Dyella monticola]
MTQVSRYHPLLAALHWLLALMIIAMLAIGFFALAVTPNTDPHKIDVLEVHMAAGMLILALMMIRFIVRMCTARPPRLSSGSCFLDRITPIAHYGFYVLILLMVGSGYATGILARLPAIVFARSGEPLPPSFAIFPTWTVHRAVAVMLVGLIVLHVIAVCYHQFIKKDGLFRRMFFR